MSLPHSTEHLTTRSSKEIRLFLSSFLDGIHRKKLGPRVAVGLQSLDLVFKSEHQWTDAELARVFCQALDLEQQSPIVGQLLNELEGWTSGRQAQQERKEDFPSKQPLLESDQGKSYNPSQGENSNDTDSIEKTTPRSMRARQVFSSPLGGFDWFSWRRFSTSLVICSTPLLWFFWTVQPEQILDQCCPTYPAPTKRGTDPENFIPTPSLSISSQKIPTAPVEPELTSFSVQTGVLIVLSGILSFVFILKPFLRRFSWPSSSHRVRFNGPSTFRSQSIGGKESPRFNSHSLQKFRRTLQIQEPPLDSRKINAEASVDTTAKKGGFPTLIHQKESPSSCVLWIIEDGQRRSLPRSRSLVREITDHLKEWKLHYRWIRYQASPSSLRDVQCHKTISIEGLLRESEPPPCLILGDSRGIHRERIDQRETLLKLAQLPRVIWVEPEDSSLETAGAQYLQSLGFVVCSGEPKAIVESASRVFLGPPGPFSIDPSGFLQKQASFQSYRSELSLETLEVVVDDATFGLAQVCALIPPPFSVALADQLRREFFNKLPRKRLMALLDIEGTQASSAGLTFPDRARYYLLRRMGATWTRKHQLEVVEFLLEIFKDARPPHVAGQNPSLEYLQWKFRQLQVLLFKDPDKAIKELERFRDTPLGLSMRRLFMDVASTNEQGRAFRQSTRGGGKTLGGPPTDSDNKMPLIEPIRRAETIGTLQRYCRVHQKWFRGQYPSRKWRYLFFILGALTFVTIQAHRQPEIRSSQPGKTVAASVFDLRKDIAPTYFRVERLEEKTNSWSEVSEWQQLQSSEAFRPPDEISKYRFVFIQNGANATHEIAPLGERITSIERPETSAYDTCCYPLPDAAGIELCQCHLEGNLVPWRDEVERIAKADRRSIELGTRQLSIGIEIADGSAPNQLSPIAQYLFENRAIDRLYRIRKSTPASREYLSNLSALELSQVIWWVDTSYEGKSLESMREIVMMAQASLRLSTVGTAEPLENILNASSPSETALLVGDEILDLLGNAELEPEDQDATPFYLLRRPFTEPEDPPGRGPGSPKGQPSCTLTIQLSAQATKSPRSIELLEESDDTEPKKRTIQLDTSIQINDGNFEVRTQWTNEKYEIKTIRCQGGNPVDLTLTPPPDLLPPPACTLRVNAVNTEGTRIEDLKVTYKLQDKEAQPIIPGQDLKIVGDLGTDFGPIEFRIERNNRFYSNRWSEEVTCSNGAARANFTLRERKFSTKVNGPIRSLLTREDSETVLVITDRNIYPLSWIDWASSNSEEAMSFEGQPPFIARSSGGADVVVAIGKRGKTEFWELSGSQWNKRAISNFDGTPISLQFHGSSRDFFVASRGRMQSFAYDNSYNPVDLDTKPVNRQILEVNLSPQGNVAVIKDTGSSGLRVFDIGTEGIGDRKPKDDQIEGRMDLICALKNGIFITEKDRNKQQLQFFTSDWGPEEIEAGGKLKHLTCSKADEPMIAFALEDGSIRVFLVNPGGAVPLRLENADAEGPQRTEVTAIAFSPNSGELISGDGKGHVYTWRYGTERR